MIGAHNLSGLLQSCQQTSKCYFIVNLPPVALGKQSKNSRACSYLCGTPQGLRQPAAWFEELDEMIDDQLPLLVIPHHGHKHLSGKNRGNKWNCGSEVELSKENYHLNKESKNILTDRNTSKVRNKETCLSTEGEKCYYCQHKNGSVTRTRGSYVELKVSLIWPKHPSNLCCTHTLITDSFIYSMF